MLDNNTPLDVHLVVKWDDIKRLPHKLFKIVNKKNRTVGEQLPVGEAFRIQLIRHTFSGVLHVRNTYELFEVKAVSENDVPVTYTMQELSGGDIQGIFYREELTPLQDPRVYAIEILKTRKRKSKTQYRIRYVHFP